MVAFGNLTKSTSRSKSWTIVPNRTLEFRTLDFCKTDVENQCNKCLEAQLFRYNTACFFVKWLHLSSGLLCVAKGYQDCSFEVKEGKDFKLLKKIGEKGRAF